MAIIKRSNHGNDDNGGVKIYKQAQMTATTPTTMHIHTSTSRNSKCHITEIATTTMTTKEKHKVPSATTTATSSWPTATKDTVRRRARPTPHSTCVDTTATAKTTTTAATTIHRHYHSNWCTGAKLPWLYVFLITWTHAAQHLAGAMYDSHGRSAPSGRRGARTLPHYSQPLTADNNNDSFRPIIPRDISPEYIARNVFTETGQYRVFQPASSDLRRVSVSMERKETDTSNKVVSPTNTAPATQTNHINKTTEGDLLAQTLQAERRSNRKQPIASGRPAGEKINRAAEVAATEEVQGVHVEATTIHADHPTASSSSISTSGSTSTHARVAHQRTSNNANKRPVDIATANNVVVHNEMKELEQLLAEYVENFFDKGQYEPTSDLIFALQQNGTDGANTPNAPQSKRPVRHVAQGEAAVLRRADGEIDVNIPRALESGRLLFFAGLKKVLWPIYMGLNILKSLLFALFLPTLIGSFGKLLGKGIETGSAPLFIRPAEAPQDLDFRDNTLNFNDDNKFGLTEEGTKDDGYVYNQAEASQTQNHYVYNQPAVSRYGNEQNKMQDSYLNAFQSISSASFKNSNSISGSSSAGGLGAPMRTKPIAPANTNTYQTFQKVPASSLLLSNYDPFYSPLLSRLDSVFAQLKLNSDNETCREKLICLMYANPAKYAPYSNLVSAQLSRELNELRKPTSDNPDILRFFKYMRAAKDGQDGIDCEKSFDRCKEFKDFENPAMVSTYHDINKLVQARKLT